MLAILNYSGSMYQTVFTCLGFSWSHVDIWPWRRACMFYGIHGKCCKLHDFVHVAVEMEGVVLQEIQELKLRALSLAHVPTFPMSSATSALGSYCECQTQL